MKPAEARWIFALMSFAVFPVDNHERCIGKHENVSTTQEAHDLTVARNANVNMATCVRRMDCPGDVRIRRSTGKRATTDRFRASTKPKPSAYSVLLPVLAFPCYADCKLQGARGD